MAAPNPSIKGVNVIKANLLRPALTSHYECYFPIPSEVSGFISKTVPTNGQTTQLLTLSCSEASLPGSSLATHEMNNDFTGVTQRHVYRRLYDDRIDFTFYVNHTYTQIRLFERWMQFISGEQQANATDITNFYRMKYPKSYKTTLYITKFERDFGKKSGSKLVYSFFNAFPISIGSMPISYDSSQLLKCSVSFGYDRYIAEAKQGELNQSSPDSPEEQSIFNSNSISNAYGSSLGLDLGINPANYFNNTSPNAFNLSPGTLTNTVGEGEEIINAINSNQTPVEAGLPYVGRNVGPIAPFSGI